MTDPFPNPLERPFLLDPFPWYARMRREAPVAVEPESGSYIVFAYDDVKRVLTDYQTFSSKVPFPLR